MGLPSLMFARETCLTPAYLASFEAFPRKLRMIGVTGTDKNHLVLIHHLLTQSGIRAGMISTVNADWRPGARYRLPRDHPDCPISRHTWRRWWLRYDIACSKPPRMVGARARNRLQLRPGGITNVTHEHLITTAIMRITSRPRAGCSRCSETPRKRIGNLQLAVLNKDDRSYDYLNVSPPDYDHWRINEAHGG